MKKLLILAALTGIGTVMAVVPQQPLFSHENIHQEVPIDRDKVNLVRTFIPEDRWGCLYRALFFLDKRNMLNEENILLFVNEECLKDTDIKITSLKNIPITEILKLYRNGIVESIRSKLIKRNYLYKDTLLGNVLAAVLIPLTGILMAQDRLAKENLSFANAPASIWLPSFALPFIFVPAFGYLLFADSLAIRELEADMNKIDDLIQKIEKIQKEAHK